VLGAIENWCAGAEPVMVTEEDYFADFCLWSYEPQTAVENKWRSSNLLRHSFEVAKVGSRVYQLCQAIQGAIGAGNTVWGVKWQIPAGGVSSEVSWEFYFYDYDRLERSISIERLVEILTPFANCDLVANEKRPYFMFSIDVDKSWGEETLAELEEVSIYIGNTGSNVSSGISYGLTKAGLAFNNLYYFFDAKQEYEAVVEKVICSAHLDLEGLDLEQIMWPELTDCGVLVAANKRENEGFYFSRIDISQLIYGLKRLQCPRELVEYIEANSQYLDHMLYDLGFDYKMEDGELKFVKGAYYGFF
jgi:hypothetical protein